MPSITGKRALMEYLSAHGVEIVFGNPGSTESPVVCFTMRPCSRDSSIRSMHSNTSRIE